MARTSAAHPRHERVRVDFRVDDNFRFRRARVRETSGFVFNGHDGFARHDQRVYRDTGHHAGVSWICCSSANNRRRAALVASAGHALGWRPFGRQQIFLYYVLRPLLKIFSPRTADEKFRRATRWFARGVVKGLPFGKLEYKNISPATFSPPCIVISNHQSAVDVMLVVGLPGDVRQTAKKRVFDSPFLGIGCKILGHIMVKPNDPQTTLQRCRERLAAGASRAFLSRRHAFTRWICATLSSWCV